VGVEVELLRQAHKLVLVHDAALLSKLDKEPGFRLDDELVSHRSSTPRIFCTPTPSGSNVRRAARIPATRSSSMVVWWIGTGQPLCGGWRPDHIPYPHQFDSPTPGMPFPKCGISN